MQQFINNSLHPIFEIISNLIGKAVQIVWYYPVVYLCIFCGVLFTIYLGFVQFRGFKHAIELIRGKYDNPNEPGLITHFQALIMPHYQALLGLAILQVLPLLFLSEGQEPFLDVDRWNFGHGNQIC